jgi:hypothetical protein
MNFSNALLLGFEHLLELGGLDHVLYILTLCIGYHWKNWKQILLSLSGFTLGHTISLAIIILARPSISYGWVEIVIPITIMIGALAAQKKVMGNKSSSKKPLLFLTFFFGLIHGMAFSNQLNAIMSRSSNLIEVLIGFNIGLELAQILIAIIYFLIMAFLFQSDPTRVKRLMNDLCMVIFGMSFYILIERIF